MKKILLICGAGILSFSAFSQSRLASPSVAGRPEFQEQKLIIADEKTAPPAKSNPAAAARHGQSGNSVQAVSTLGTAANALTAVGIRNFVWADPIMNTVMFTRRAVGGTTGVINGGRFFYDLSTDNGVTWDTANGPVYTPSLSPICNPSNARYPQGAIYNPAGTSNPMDAYMTYYGAALDSTNYSQSGLSPWGGNVYGVHKLDGSSAPTQHELISDSATGIWYVIPELMHMCKNGITYALSESDYCNSDIVGGRGVAFDYNGTMIWQKGTWNSTTNEYDYTQSLLSVPSGTLPYNTWYAAPSTSSNTSPVSTMAASSMAFNDDGTIGYMVNKQFLNVQDSPDSTSLLYIWKTTNGGANWYMLDSTPSFDEANALCVDSGFGMGTSGQVFDVAVDANNNLHIVIVLGTKYMSSTYGTSVYYYENYGSIFDVYTSDGGLTWWAHKLKTDSINEVYGVMGDPATAAARQVYDNRPQITRSYDGTKLFFSWFETDTTMWLPDANNLGLDNQHPDMHVTGYDVTSNMWTIDSNMTAYPALGGDADGSCFLGGVSYYALSDGAGGYKIPTVIATPSATTTNNNPDWQTPFTFKYLDGISVASSAYTVGNTLPGSPNPNHVQLRTIQPVGIHQVNSNNDFIVTPVRPNPVVGNSDLLVQISKPGTVKLEVRNVLGQIVSAETFSNQSSGLHKYTINASELRAGMYLYTVTYDGQQITQKMNVQ